MAEEGVRKTEKGYKGPLVSLLGGSFGVILDGLDNLGGWTAWWMH